MQSKAVDKIVKLARRPRNRWYHADDLYDMRAAAEAGERPIDMQHYSKRTLEEVNRELAENKEMHGDQAMRANAGERQDNKEFGKSVANYGLLGTGIGLAGSLALALSRGPETKYIWGIPAGAALGALTRAIIGRKKIKDPGEYIPSKKLQSVKKDFSDVHSESGRRAIMRRLGVRGPNYQDPGETAAEYRSWGYSPEEIESALSSDYSGIPQGMLIWPPKPTGKKPVMSIRVSGSPPK